MGLEAIGLSPERVQAGIGAAARWLNEQLLEVPSFANLQELLREVHLAEQGLLRLARALIRLRDAGLAVDADYIYYEKQRQNIYVMQVRLDRLMRAIFVQVPQVGQVLPRPQLAPKVTVNGPVAIGEEVPQQQVVAVGPDGTSSTQAAVAAGGAAAISPMAWMYAGITLLVVGSIVVVAGMVTTVALSETIRDVLVNWRYLAAQEHNWEVRRQLFEQCIASGGTPEACVRQAATLAPDPEIKELPRGNDWIPWVVGGAVILAALGVGVYVFRALTADRRGVRGLESGSRRGPSYRRLTPGEFLDADDDGGGLEID